MSKQNGNKGRRFDRGLQGRSRPSFTDERAQAAADSKEILGSASARSAAGSQNCVRRICFPVRMRMQRRRLPADAESVIWPVRNVIC